MKQGEQSRDLHIPYLYEPSHSNVTSILECFRTSLQHSLPTMDPIMPIYPHLDRYEKQESSGVAVGQEAATSAENAFPSPHDGPASPVAPSFGGTSHPLPPRPTQLYSPTQHEIESHPIRQRLSLTRDDIATGLGFAPEEPRELFESTSQTNSNSRQAQEGSARLFDTMAEVQEGDKGMFCALYACRVTLLELRDRFAREYIVSLTVDWDASGDIAVQPP